MAAYIRRKSVPITLFTPSRTKSTVASRVRDPTFENLTDQYQNLHKVISIQQLILADPLSPSISIDFINRLSPKLQLNSFATQFLSQYPHIFHIFNHPSKNHPFCTLTKTALQLFSQEQDAIMASLPLALHRLIRLLSMSCTKTLPLKAFSKVYRELGLPYHFKDSLILRNPHVFALQDGDMLKLVGSVGRDTLVAAVDDWRVIKCSTQDCDMDRTEIQYGFSQSFPRGMRFKKDFMAKEKEWQRLAYVGPYDEMGVKGGMEKRAVAVYHEFLSVTVEKMAEVAKIRHFSKWFGIDFDIRDLFLDHLGMFYVSTKGDRHTVFLREAYKRGRLIEPNPVYEVRIKLLDLMFLGRRGMIR